MAPLPSPNVFKGREVQDDIKRIEEKIKKAKTPQARQKWIDRLAAVKKLGKLPKDPKKTPKTKKSLLKHKTPKQPPGFTLGIGKGGSSRQLSEMQKEIRKRSGQSAEEMYGTGLFAADPGGPMSDDLWDIEEPYGTSDWRGFKHGGRIKKTKKRKSKRAALRGHRKELRGG